MTYCNLANFVTKKVAVRSNFTLFKVLTQYIFCKVLHAEENGSDNFVKKKGSWEAISEIDVEQEILLHFRGKSFR